MTWDRTSVRTLGVDPAALWDVLADVENWPRWDPDVARVVLHGPAATGSTGFLYPSGRFRGGVHGKIAEDFTFTSWRPGHGLALCQPVPLGRMDLSLSVAADPGGAELTQRIVLDTPLRAVMVRIIGADLVANFGRKCAALTRLAAAKTG
ncbi:SRPBCC family protein [Amycolatopsis sp. VS8301801F10]|uniref:SRPBCC family protein n=1 Tax=Amycolatopsis sp. VS8301801F10 TaxID=2652442 RepID=UPI0038FBFFA9